MYSLTFVPVALALWHSSRSVRAGLTALFPPILVAAFYLTAGMLFPMGIQVAESVSAFGDFHQCGGGNGYRGDSAVAYRNFLGFSARMFHPPKVCHNVTCKALSSMQAAHGAGRSLLEEYTSLWGPPQELIVNLKCQKCHLERDNYVPNEPLCSSLNLLVSTSVDLPPTKSTYLAS